LSRIVKRSVTIAGHSTSVSLEEPFWLGLRIAAKAENISLAALLRRIDARRSAGGDGANLSSAIRVFVLEWLAERAGVDLTAGWQG
jgi:predicted DNA-binding ribbon-helix-helix protein